MATISEYERDAKNKPTSAAEIVTSGGTRIYLLPVETLPGHLNNIFLVDDPTYPVLFDVGTKRSSDELDARFEEIESRFGCTTKLKDLQEVVISHAHLDHYGDAHRMHDMGLPISIHELDARVLINFDERLAVASRDMAVFLRQSGMDEADLEVRMQLYKFEKSMFESLEPDRRLRHGDTIGPGWDVTHVPGHCPGMVMLTIDDVILTADHLLERITPAQHPQSITPFTGLENYLRSLKKIYAMSEGRLGLGAHGGPIPNMKRRIHETVTHHEVRLRQVFNACRAQPLTVAEIARELFGTLQNYGKVLGLTETGAHVEYLHALGFLHIENIDDVKDRIDAPVKYSADSRVRAPQFIRTER